MKICVRDCMIIEANGNWDPSSGDDLRCTVRERASTRERGIGRVPSQEKSREMSGYETC